ncbi:zinc finger FYVE domain-containing protein 1 isoform X2 [Aethina tumida]|uniref:zinc finger FYVE domain-containing protein 1 isoform X2 n=1 Tax=Aethina tumida TaxID=116153 RepID=UPI00214741DE|nr:zinc finger FYVE domain-containing protein 1 isoform X2 [Aethina tumida]
MHFHKMGDDTFLHPSQLDSVDLTLSDGCNSVLLINESEELFCNNEKEFVRQLKLPEDKRVKVVAIFGNTGEGKSYTLNQTFFDGERVFKTSPAQNPCNIGVWAKYDPKLNVICLDTEGITRKNQQRTRLLLKILAISDIVIYQTRAPRLHTDMYSFLHGASQAYNKHFSHTLTKVLEEADTAMEVNSLGPAVIVFHETQHTDTLDEGSTVMESAEEKLRGTFKELGLDISAFSSVKYVGLKSLHQPTKFEKLRDALKKELESNDVRTPRKPMYIYLMLKSLNDKFRNALSETSPDVYWSSFFTCQEKCQSCKTGCTLSMGHKEEGEPHSSPEKCQFQYQFQNAVDLCKMCLKRGIKNVVKRSYQSANESSWSSYLNYVWSGYILECPRCGEIYRSRQHWYGNKTPEECGVVDQENVHIWSGDKMYFQERTLFGSQNTAQKVIDSVSSFSDVVASVGSQPTQVLGEWMTDKINPSFWRPNHEIKACFRCQKTFLPLQKKHHCRACGEGFCGDCSSKRQTVPSKGWHQEVRVCDGCYREEPPSLSHATDGTENRARVIGETVMSSMSAVKSVLNVSKDFIKDSVRPAYWTPDSECVRCCVCEKPFDDKRILHHCRDCGKGVCDVCSQNRRSVPLRGWTTPVRVCNNCCC